MKLRKLGMAGVLLSGYLTGGSAAAVDGVSFELGQGDSANMGRVGLQWNMNKQWLKGDQWHVGGFWDLALGHWTRDALPGQKDNLTEIGLTPSLRLQQNSGKGLYAEGGIGFHLMSRTSLGTKRFGTPFQFGNHLGVGYRFGPKGALDLGLRYQHLSNASIKQPNNGINFTQVRVQYWF
ncbi:MAG: acyloxyacyl hydrolase [Burkholderiales bacterium]